ncbi:ribbon-helix-helix domain-containing protein [Arenibaculum sp.]|jgi:predicted DNA-binding ribbon-helix-helix protein|uniref:ribbon-helix-helix domain-containing protein n=1 Tax=Arenibaculum sp. TaxID=2865862 RepID=UPI002E0F3A4D|nr:ribbon-helix-helix domain-containing protein [Arenibaculum sp.]
MSKPPSSGGPVPSGRRISTRLERVLELMRQDKILKREMLIHGRLVCIPMEGQLWLTVEEISAREGIRLTDIVEEATPPTMRRGTSIASCLRLYSLICLIEGRRPQRLPPPTKPAGRGRYRPRLRVIN